MVCSELNGEEWNSQNRTIKSLSTAIISNIGLGPIPKSSIPKTSYCFGTAMLFIIRLSVLHQQCNEFNLSHHNDLLMLLNTSLKVAKKNCLYNNNRKKACVVMEQFSLVHSISQHFFFTTSYYCFPASFDAGFKRPNSAISCF